MLLLTRDQNTYVAKLNNADPNETARVLQNMFGTSEPAAASSRTQ